MPKIFRVKIRYTEERYIDFFADDEERAIRSAEEVYIDNLGNNYTGFTFDSRERGVEIVEVREIEND